MDIFLHFTHRVHNSLITLGGTSVYFLCMMPQYQLDQSLPFHLVEGFPCQRGPDLQPLAQHCGCDELVAGNLLVHLVVGGLVKQSQVVQLVANFPLGPLLQGESGH